VPKLNNEDLNGIIKELHKEHNLEFYTTNNLKIAKKWIKQIKENIKNSIVIDIETSGFDAVNNDMLGIVITVNLKKSVYINTRTWDDNEIVDLITEINKIPNNKVAHNMFFDISFIKIRYKITLNIDKDTMIYTYCLYTNRIYYDKGIGLKDLTRDMTPYGNYEEELEDYKTHYCKLNKIKKSDFSYAMIDDDILCPYALMDGIATIYLYNLFEKDKIRFIEGGWDKLQKLLDIKHKVTYLYIDAKTNGFKIDREMIKELDSEWREKRDIIFSEIKQMKEIKQSEKIIKRKALIKMQKNRKSIAPLSRCRQIWKENYFNFNSNAHLKVLFYDVLNLEVIKKTEKGEPSTDEEVISKFGESGHPFMLKLLEALKYEKGLSTFLGTESKRGNGLINFTTDEHPYVHSNFNHCGTISSRTATTEPNQSQVPSRGELKKVKKCYIVEDDRKLIGFDYKSSEMYIATAISGEENYFNIIENELDFHSVNALAFEDKMDLPEGLSYNDKLEYIKENYKQTWRYYAKALGFSLLYGTTEFGLSKTLDVSKKEAKEIIKSFLKKNKGIDNYIESTKDFVCEHGYVENFMGQRVYLPNTKGFNRFKTKVRKTKRDYHALASLRFAINYKIQSANAFLLYEGMLKFFEKVKELNLDIKLLSTIYDACYFSVNKNVESKLVSKLLKESFEVDFKGVRMEIDITQSDTGRWYDWENIDLNNINI